MSYCVECGVKLADSESVCPLCNTKVINPNHPAPEEQPDRPYPSIIENQITGLRRRELAWVLMIFLLLPVGATVIIDLLTGDIPFALNWSTIVIGAGALLAVWALVPLVFTKISIYAAVALDFAAIAGFLAVIALYVGQWRWCTHLAIPITVATGLGVCTMIAIIRSKKLRILTRAALCCITLGLYILALELIIDYTVLGYLTVSWSIYAIVPLVFVALLLFTISRRPRLMDELKRRLFV